MKIKFLPFIGLLLGLVLYAPSGLAVNEVCQDGSNDCCVAPQIVEDGGGCGPVRGWVGDEATGSCEIPVFDPASQCSGGKAYNCATDSCVCPSGTIPNPCDPTQCIASTSCGAGQTYCCSGQHPDAGPFGSCVDKDHGPAAGVQNASHPNACVNQASPLVLANACTGACASACSGNEVEINGVCLPFARMVHDDVNNTFLGEEPNGQFTKEIGGGGLWTDDGSGNAYYDSGKVGVLTNSPSALLHVNPDTTDDNDTSNLFAVYSRNFSTGVSPTPTLKVTNHHEGGQSGIFTGRVGIGGVIGEPDAALQILGRNDDVFILHAENFAVGEVDDDVSASGDKFVTISSGSVGLSSGTPDERTVLNVMARPQDDAHPLVVNYGDDSPRFQVDKNGLTRVYGDLQVDGSCIGCGGGGGTWPSSGSDIYFEGGNVAIGNTNPQLNLHISDAGDAGIWLEADTDNNGESDNAYIKFTQDGNRQIGGILGMAGENDASPESENTYSGSLENAMLLGGTNDVISDVAYPLQLGTDETVRMTIAPNGDVGIGTNNPTDELHVYDAGTSGSGGITIHRDYYARLQLLSDNYWSGIELRRDDAGTSGRPYIDFTNNLNDNFGIRLSAPNDNLFRFEGGDLEIGIDDEVDGQIRFFDDDDAGNQKFEIAFNASNEDLFIRSDEDTNAIFYNSGSISFNDNHIYDVRELEFKDWDDDTGGSDDKVRMLSRDGALYHYNGGVVVGNWGNNNSTLCGYFGQAGDSSCDVPDGNLVVEHRLEMTNSDITGIGDLNFTGNAEVETPLGKGRFTKTHWRMTSTHHYAAIGCSDNISSTNPSYECYDYIDLDEEDDEYWGDNNAQNWGRPEDYNGSQCDHGEIAWDFLEPRCSYILGSPHCHYAIIRLECIGGPPVLAFVPDIDHDSWD